MGGLRIGMQAWSTIVTSVPASGYCGLSEKPFGVAGALFLFEDESRERFEIRRGLLVHLMHGVPSTPSLMP